MKSCVQGPYHGKDREVVGGLNLLAVFVEVVQNAVVIFRKDEAGERRETSENVTRGGVILATLQPWGGFVV